MESDPVGYFFAFTGLFRAVHLSPPRARSEFLPIYNRALSWWTALDPPSISPAVITVGVSSIYNRGFFAPRRCDARKIMQPWSGLSSRLSLHHAAEEPQFSGELFCAMARILAISLQYSAASGGISPLISSISPQFQPISSKSPTIQIAQSQFFAHFCTHF